MGVPRYDSSSERSPTSWCRDRKTAVFRHVSFALLCVVGLFHVFQLRRKLDAILEMLQQCTIDPEILLFWLPDATDRANSLNLMELGNSLAHWRLRFRKMFAAGAPEESSMVYCIMLYA